jgi:HEAT repeat protein
MLGALKAKAAVPALVNALSEPDAAEAAVKALDQIGDPAAVEPLIALLNKPETSLNVRLSAIAALGNFKDPRAVPVLLEILSKGNTGDESHASVEALKAIGDRNAVPGLIKLLSSDKPEMRNAAAYLLGSLKDPSAAAQLVEALKGEQEDSVKGSITRALVELGDPSVADSLTQEALPGGQQGISAVMSLKKLGEAGAPGLRRVLGESQDRELRKAAAQALGEMKSVASIPTLQTAINLDPNGEVSSEAALALGKIGSLDAVKALVAAINTPDSNPNRWDAILDALRMSKDPSAGDALAELLNSSLLNRWPGGQFMVAEKLAERGDARAKPILEKFSQMPGSSVRAQAALSKLTSPPASAQTPTAPPATGTMNLVGTTWKLGEFTVLFKDATTINVKAPRMPSGMDGTYTLEDGKITVNIAMETKTGTWNGTTLVIDGMTGEKQ